MIQKIVITAAGLGTRLLPITKEIPKEMMPVFLHGKNGEPVVKPLIQAIFEQFFHQGLREYCIIMGRQKRIIQDHFTIDEKFLKNFKKKSKYRQDLEKIYLMLNRSKIFWVNQPEPRGFGDAIKHAESFVGNDDFLVIAGDTLLPKGDKIIKKLLNEKLTGKNQRGFKIFLGGGLGNKSFVGHQLEDFTSDEDLLYTSIAVLQIFDRMGNSLLMIGEILVTNQRIWQKNWKEYQ